MSGSPRVVIADEQPTLRALGRRLLEQDGFTVCGEAANADGAVDAALRERPDLCVIGLPIPGSGIGATARIATALPQTAVVIVTATESRAELVDAIRAGAVGYLLKGRGVELREDLFPSVLRSVLAGEAAIPRTMVAWLVREFQTQGRRRVIASETGRVDLTARETEVMQLMCEGLSTREIAERLFVSPVTIRRHISETVSKLGVEDRQAAVALLDGQI